MGLVGNTWFKGLPTRTHVDLDRISVNTHSHYTKDVGNFDLTIELPRVFSYRACKQSAPVVYQLAVR